MSSLRIQIIVPVFNEKETVRPFVLAIEKVRAGFLNVHFDIVFVDDGSKDGTWEQIGKLKSEFTQFGIRGIKFTRNFGKEAAISAALDHFTGDACILMDVDLQHPPELIPQMIEIWQSGEAQVVEGRKISHERRGSLRGTLVGWFYGLFNWLGKIDLEKASDFKLLDQKVVQTYRELPERQLFFRGLVHWLGYKAAVLEFEVPDRVHGDSKWSMVSLFSYAARNIISFSTRPLRLISYLGLFSIALSILLSVQTLWMKFSGKATDGFTTVIILILFFGGIHLAALGLLSEYIGRIFDEIKKRPRYVVQETK